jgi:flavin reductase (DIM6/NTAB) family NADH-FMN oxidoreductase RutF
MNNPKQITFSLEDLLQLEQRFRTTFINSLGGFKSPGLIGTISKDGNTNLAIFNSFFHVGAHPPLFGFVVRPDSAERHTLNNLLATGVFTVNHIGEAFYRKAHQTAARYPGPVSEFAATGLTELYNEHSIAPFVAESKVRLAARFRQRIDVTENGTIIIIAEITYISLPENCVGADGFVNLEKAGSITCTGLDSYHRTEQIARLAYAKPDKQSTLLASE